MRQWAATSWTPERIMALRKSLGLDQIAFADLVGTSAGNVIRWERGQLRPQRTAGILLDRLAAQLQSQEPPR